MKNEAEKWARSQLSANYNRAYARQHETLRRTRLDRLEALADALTEAEARDLPLRAAK